MTEKSIGMIELSSVVAGFLVADAALKAGTVRLVLSRSICSGKYMVLVAGDPSAVQSAIAAACEAANGCLIDSFVITNIHPMSSPRWPHVGRAAGRGARDPGIIQRRHPHQGRGRLREGRADPAVRGPRGDGARRQAFVTMVGDISAVQTAVEAGRKIIADAGMLVNAAVITRPHKDVYREVV